VALLLIDTRVAVLASVVYMPIKEFPWATLHTRRIWAYSGRNLKSVLGDYCLYEER